MGGRPRSSSNAKGARWRLVSVLVAGAVPVAAIIQRHALVGAVSWLPRVPLPLFGAALGLEVLSLFAAAALQSRLLAGSGVRAPRRSMLALVWASNAVGASFPAGAAASTVYTYRHLTRRGTPGRVVAWLLVATGIVSVSTLALLAVIGVQLRGLLSGCTAADALEIVALTGVVAVGIALLARMSRRPGGFGRLGRYVQRVTATMQPYGPCSEAPDNGDLSNLPAVALSGRDWAVVVMLGTLNWVADAAVLAVSLLAVGANIPWRGFILAYALSQLGSSVPILPGSVGIAEGSLVVVLVCAGVTAPSAFAATVMYRLASFWLQLPPGWAAWAWLRHSPPFPHASTRGDIAKPSSVAIAIPG